MSCSEVFMVKSGLRLATVPTAQVADLASTGWRDVEQVQPDGTTKTIPVPLTSIEFLHPEEGYYLPNNSFHENVTINAGQMLRDRYAKDPTVGVFTDMLVEWDNPDMKNNCPDLFVAFSIAPGTLHYQANQSGRLYQLRLRRS
ncbi:MAG: hypothetical protein GDA48_26850 [Hormoscilla sp. GM102CHS1]|nr:hypothetical protein [Hormoscilla sp. GM102CHS1]